ncbi:MAG: hypothetical protein JSW70_08380 [Syntrophobacterales bacterium]|nr:MAG: hypothetical protein JSW70_08380 [Syntrophobacterales bacterium]
MDGSLREWSFGSYNPASIDETITCRVTIEKVDGWNYTRAEGIFTGQDGLR